MAPKRKSVTDGMESDAEKLMSGVQRKLIKVLDAETQSDELRKHWSNHPSSCEVVVCGPLGHPRYIRNITDRLEALGFSLGHRFPYRPKSPGQPSVELEAQIKRRQAKEAADLTADQRASIDQNRTRALEIRSKRNALWDLSEGDETEALNIRSKRNAFLADLALIEGGETVGTTVHCVAPQ